MSKKQGFTLVELLVVIAIIALLMSILMPALSRAKQQAKVATCQTNLRQWGSIFAMYTGDHQGFFMPGWLSNFQGMPAELLYKVYWMEALRPYYGDQGDLRLCSAATKPGTELGLDQYGTGGGPYSAWGVFDGSWEYSVAGDYGSYGINGWCGNPPPGAPKDLGQEHPIIYNWRRDDVKGAGNIPLFLADQWIDGWPRHFDSPPELNGMAWGSTGNENMGRYCVDRHNGFVNCLFLDYSVRKVGLKELWTLKWHRKFELNGPWTIAGDVSPSDWPDWMQSFKDF
jgi:prepilin-type N-terminal cleavage/methylation domain-containing protein